jgi:hypothetical protein
VPAASVPAVVEAEESAEAEADENEDSSSEDDDVALDDSWQQFEGVDEQQSEDLDEDADAAADSAAAVSEDGDEASEQLPQSIVEALQTHNWPSNVRKQQMQQRAEQQSQEGNSEQQSKQHQQRSQQQQQQMQRLEPLRLHETNPMYLPVLTDEDLDNDPPGHQSGYVAVIGRPNAGEQAFQCQVWGVRIGVAASWFARLQLWQVCIKCQEATWTCSVGRCLMCIHAQERPGAVCIVVFDSAG